MYKVQGIASFVQTKKTGEKDEEEKNDKLNFCR